MAEQEVSRTLLATSHRRLTFLHGKDIRFRLPGRRPHTTIERLVYSTIITIFDTLDAVLRWAHPSDKKLEDSVRKTDSPLSFALISYFDVAHRV